MSCCIPEAERERQRVCLDLSPEVDYYHLQAVDVSNQTVKWKKLSQGCHHLTILRWKLLSSQEIPSIPCPPCYKTLDKVYIIDVSN